MSDAEWDLNEVASPPQSRCAFCLQPVAAPSSTPCPKCRAVYHPDCWTANDQRCAVYGCEPVAPPVPPDPPPRRRARFQAEPLTTPPAGGNRFPWGILVVIGVVAANLARMGSHQNKPTRPEFPEILYQGSIPRESQATRLAHEVRQFLGAQAWRDGLPEDRESRDALRREADAAADKLMRARELLLNAPPMQADRFRDVNDLADRLQRLRQELAGP